MKLIKELKCENKQCLEDCEGCCIKMEDGKCACRDTVIVSALEELEQYRTIGTIVECRRAG